MITWNLLVGATLFVAALTVVTVSISTFHRLWSKIIRPRREAQMQRARDFVVYITEVGFNEEALNRKFSHREWKLIEDLSISFISKMTGEVQDFLVEMLEYRRSRERAIRRLKLPGQIGKSRAAHMLGALKPHIDSISALINLLADSNGEIREIAAEALGKLQAADAVVPLLQTLAGKKRVPAGIVVDSLIRIGPVGTGSLRIALHSSEPEVRAMAIEVLGALNAEEAVDEITDLLAVETSEDVITRIAIALGRIGSRRPAVALLSLLSYSIGWRAKTAVIWALGQIKYVGAVDLLKETVLEGNFNLARAAAESLAKVGEPGRQALLEIHNTSGPGHLHAAEVLSNAGWLNNDDSAPTPSTEESN